MPQGKSTETSAWSLWIPDEWLAFIRQSLDDPVFQHGLIAGTQIHRMWIARFFVPYPNHALLDRPAFHPTIDWFACWVIGSASCPYAPEPSWIYLNVTSENVKARWWGPMVRKKNGSWRLDPRWVQITVRPVKSTGLIQDLFTNSLPD